jgi:hypothetical protein
MEETVEVQCKYYPRIYLQELRKLLWSGSISGPRFGPRTSRM